MAIKKTSEPVDLKPPNRLRQWLNIFSQLWYGVKGPTRFETRLQKLARHREESEADVKSRMLKTTATARWWRRFH